MLSFQMVNVDDEHRGCLSITSFLIILSRNLMMRYFGWSEKLSTDMRILYGLSSCNRSLTLRKLLCEDMAP